MCEGVGKSGSPTSRWMTSESSHASSMISRMRETGMELAIVEGRAGPLVFWGRNEPPPVRSTDVDPGGPDDERDQYLRREPGSGRLDRPTGLIQRRLQVLRTILVQVARAPML